ncbi:MAG: hypothetical protein OXH96_19285 [Spirochaetaceae bacterium]|nr:hypothetical protein [Spirochaetaceae bacterium]
MPLCFGNRLRQETCRAASWTLTATAQLETAFAAAERQSRRASTNVVQECCHDLPGLLASPSSAGDREADACGAGAADAAAMTASAAHGVAAVGRKPRWRRDIEGHEDRHTGSDRCTRSSDESPA